MLIGPGAGKAGQGAHSGKGAGAGMHGLLFCFFEVKGEDVEFCKLTLY